MKYLRIKIDGQEKYFAAYDNRDKKKKRQEPDFKGKDIAIWINDNNPNLA